MSGGKILVKKQLTWCLKRAIIHAKGHGGRGKRASLFGTGHQGRFSGGGEFELILASNVGVLQRAYLHVGWTRGALKAESPRLNPSLVNYQLCILQIYSISLSLTSFICKMGKAILPFGACTGMNLPLLTQECSDPW